MMVKSKLLVYLVLFLMVFGIKPVSVVAQGDSNPTTTPATIDEKAAQAERLKVLKSQITEKLSAPKAQLIAGRCKSAQSKVTEMRQGLQTSITKRTQVNTDINLRLEKLLSKMKAADLDTVAYETASNELNDIFTTFKNNMVAFDTKISDVAELDCASDPNTFVAALTSAREAQTQLRSQSLTIKQFVKTELKTVLQDIKSQLATKTKAEQTQPSAGEES